jgi:uncharacterized protein (DUF58 family)
MLIDTSESMRTGGKFDYARRLAGALCYVGMVRLDGIELHPFSNKLGRRHLCTGGRHRFGPVLDSIGAMEAGGHTDFFAVVREFMTRYPQRGLAIVISDFLDDQGCERALQFLADFGHELMLLQVWSAEDRTPPWDGELELEDAETGGRLKVQFDASARARYTEAFDEYAAAIRKLALRNTGRYAGVSTSQPVEDVVFGPVMHPVGGRALARAGL